VAVPLEQRNRIYWATPDHKGLLPEEIHASSVDRHKLRKVKVHLVVQVGNSFVSHFPRARVIINKGRYLAIDLPVKEIKDIE
jgi:hypothetical protein